MGEKLLSAPLIEALCEFKFDPSSPWDWTLPGRLYNQIAYEFPERSQVEEAEVHIQLGSGNPPLSQIIKGPDRVQMKRLDGSAMVQIGPHLLAINYLRLYPNWETFRELILNIFDEYIKLCGDYKLQRIGLRYINQIPFTGDGGGLESLIRVVPPLKGILEQPLIGFYQRYEFIFSSPKGNLIHQTGIRKTDQGPVLMLDLDFGSMELKEFVNKLSVEKWLNEAHDIIYQSFVESLNPDLYEKFKRGIK
ncbi:MAG: TIGR04255 family protein [Thermodesulfobacteriota bacterium]